jgi:cardiolipin synthase
MGFTPNVPNALTLLRLALAPLIAWLLLQRHDAAALVLFVVAAVSDFVDGALARRWNQQTRFGAIADPLADKATVVLAVIALTLQGSLPPWFAVVVVARDLVIVGGSLAYRAVVGHIEMVPSRISKLNTALLFLLLVGVLGSRAAGQVSSGPWLQALQFATLATLAASGLHYVAVWACKARRARRLRGGSV